jgi:hypothetical protein
LVQHVCVAVQSPSAWQNCSPAPASSHIDCATGASDVTTHAWPSDSWHTELLAQKTGHCWAA